MTTLEITNRIETLNVQILENLKSGNNSVENATDWANMQREREQLKNRLD